MFYRLCLIAVVGRTARSFKTVVLILLVINIKIFFDLTAIRFKRVTKFGEEICQLVQVNGVVEIWLSPICSLPLIRFLLLAQYRKSVL